MQPNTPTPPQQVAMNEPVTPASVSTKRRSMFEGRINRMAFFIGHVVLLAAPVVLLLAYALLNFMLGGADAQISPLRSAINIVLFLFGAVYVVLAMFILFSLYIRRLHDINVTGWVSVLLLINPASLILYVVLQAVEGTEGSNKYGPEERPSGLLAVLGLRR